MPTPPFRAAVLYADITGFTAISEGLDPERVTEIMNRCFEALEGIVVAHGGEVNKYLGDCVVAVFGLTDASAGSRSALEAALEIRGAVAALNREMSLPSRLGVHIGLDTGAVNVGEVGGEVRRERTVTGLPVRVATALEDMSSEGEILVGQTTRDDTSAEFEFRARDSLEIDDSELEVFELLGPRQGLRRIKRPSERRQATVIFLGISGFARLPAEFSADEQQALLNRCFVMLERIVRAQGGVIDKYIGESLLALFGVPDAIEDAPQRAINAAVEMRNAMDSISGDVGVALRVRAGINTGLVIAGEIGGRIKRDYTVMGDTVNVAARLKEAAGEGAIWIGPSTYRATQSAFEYRELAPLRLKGKAEPLPAWEVLSEHGQVRRLREQRGRFFSRLVGRDVELATLRRCVDELAAGRGGVATVVGEAGLGKSRLLAELLESDACRPVRVLEARSTAVGQNLSFHPFLDLFRQWAGIDDDTESDDAQARLRAAIATLTAVGGAESFPFIATLMGMQLEGEAAERVRGIEGDALEKLLFKSVRELLAALADREPLMLVFDDLHWADQSSLQLLEALLRSLRDAPVLFTLLFRPDYEQTSERVLALVTIDAGFRHTAIRLASLTTQQAEELIHALIPIDDLPQASRRLIMSKAEGNPFYLEEVVRSLVDQGAIEETDDGYRVTERIEEVEIPSTIQELVLSRVDRLDESTRHVLQLGAVIGRSFFYSLMAELLRREGVFDERLDEELSVLKRKQLLSERGAGWSVAITGGDVVQEVEFLFHHVLAQEAIYESLLQRTRTELHATVASTIETLFEHRLSDFYPMLAYHFSRADSLEKAEDYLFKAGEKAASSAASNEALNFFREAARLYMRIHGDGGDPRKKSLLEKNIGSALLTSGQLSESVEHYDRALAELGVHLAGSPARVMTRFALDISLVLANLYLAGGGARRRSASPDERETFDIMFRRFKALTTSDPKRLFLDNMGLIRRVNALDPATVNQACLAYCLGSAAFAYSGASFAISRRFLDRATEILDPDDVTEVVGHAFTRFTLNFLSGNWRDEAGIGPEIIENGVRQGVFWDVNSYLGLECDRQLRMGRFEEARRYLSRLDELGGEYGYEFAVANHDGMLTLLLLEQRRRDEALEAVNQYLDGRHEGPLRVLALGMRAKIQLLAGETEKARADLEDAEALIGKSEVIPPWHLSAYTTAELRFLAKQLHEGGRGSNGRRRVRRAVRRALHVAERVAGSRSETYRLIGHVEWARGNQGGATRWWDRAVSESERLGTVPELARALADSARCWEQSGSAALQERASSGRERCREIVREVALDIDPLSASVVS